MSWVERFEAAFAERVGAAYAIALCNGTATLHAALASLGVTRGARVAVPPLTMASTSIAVLHAGATPLFVDIDPDTWLMDGNQVRFLGVDAAIPVSLYGLHYDNHRGTHGACIDDAAQTLRPHAPQAAFTSYSFQSSKHLPLGEGGLLTTDEDGLAEGARVFSSLGYAMTASAPLIDKTAIKHPQAIRHHRLGYNYRMSDIVAQRGYHRLHEGVSTIGSSFTWLDRELEERRAAAALYAKVIENCTWMTPQAVPAGRTHDYWTYAVALEDKELWEPFVDAVERHGGERFYAAWRLTYQEPAFTHLKGVACPVAEDLQPRLVQMQTNSRVRQNADAIAAAIDEIGGTQ